MAGSVIESGESGRRKTSAAKRQSGISGAAKDNNGENTSEKRRQQSSVSKAEKMAAAKMKSGENRRQWRGRHGVAAAEMAAGAVLRRHGSSVEKPRRRQLNMASMKWRLNGGENNSESWRRKRKKLAKRKYEMAKMAAKMAANVERKKAKANLRGGIAGVKMAKKEEKEKSWHGRQSKNGISINRRNGGIKRRSGGVANSGNGVSGDGINNGARNNNSGVGIEEEAKMKTKASGNNSKRRSGRRQ
jgi:hypothetical protein